MSLEELFTGTLIYLCDLLPRRGEATLSSGCISSKSTKSVTPQEAQNRSLKQTKDHILRRKRYEIEELQLYVEINRNKNILRANYRQSTAC